MFSILSNPFFRRLAGLDRPLTRRPWRHPLVVTLGVGLFVSTIITISSIHRLLDVIASSPNPSSAQTTLQFEYVAIFYFAAILLIAFVTPLAPFFSLCRQITNGTIEHLVMTPPGWRAILSARTGFAVLRAVILSFALAAGILSLLMIFHFRDADDAWAMIAVLAFLPAPIYALSMVSLYWALRYYHVRSFAFLGLILFHAGLVAAIFILLIFFINMLAFREPQAFYLALLLAIPPCLGLGAVYGRRLMELTSGPAMEHLATGKERARPFGAVPWWRLDLLRRLWPLRTWARLRFLTNCYLLVMLLLMLPVSFSLNLGNLAAGLVVMIGGLPFFLCLMTLPRHWSEAADALPPAWTGDAVAAGDSASHIEQPPDQVAQPSRVADVLPDHTRGAPPLVLLHAILRPWQILFVLAAIAAVGAGYLLNTFADQYFKLSLDALAGGIAGDWFVRETHWPFLLMAIPAAGSLFTLLYLRLLVRFTQNPDQAGLGRDLLWPLTRLALVIGAVLILIFMWENAQHGRFSSSRFWRYSRFDPFREFLRTASLFMGLFLFAFLPLYARLSGQVLRLLREMKTEEIDHNS